VGVISGGVEIEGAIRRSSVLVYEYDFAVDGGGVGAKSMRPIGSTGVVPSGFVITDSIVEVLTPFTTAASGQGAVAVESAGDIVAAAVVSGVPYSTAGRKAGVPISAATSVKTTAARTPTFTISVGAITAGKLYLVLFGYNSTRV
jgi:hypothetical protein